MGMKLSHLLKITAIVLLFVGSAFAQDPTKWSLGKVEGRIDTEENARRAEKGDPLLVYVALKAEVESGWHLYSLEQPKGGPIATTIKVAEGSQFEIEGKITEANEAKVQPDPNFIVDGKPLETRYFVDRAAFVVPIKATGSSSLDLLALDVRFQLCNDTFCLPPKTKRVSFAGEEDVKKTAASSQLSASSQTEPPASTNQPIITREPPKDIWAFIWLAATLGALSLLTPCVFPMIPITVSYFTNHSAGSRARSVRLATIYPLGIIATFTLLGMLLAIFVGAEGINLFAANPWVNILIAAVFLFFAFNLFGAYEIAIPTGLLTKLDSLTRSHEGEGSGVIGALLMGLTFTLTSFTCTSPFVGTILVSASQGDWQMPLVGMLAFSTVFALPFFVLALVPQWVSHMPRAGGWMNSVKVAMGFLEVAAAMKFISNVDLVWKWGIFTRTTVLAIWIAIGIILSLYLLGKFQLSHDSKPERIGAFRLVSAILSLAISFYLITGLFGAKLGELEAFLPPDLDGTSTFKVAGAGSDELTWLKNDYPAALAKAKAENKRVFIDFTGYTCTNCRWMEANIFPKPEVKAEMNKFVLSSLYTDGDGAIYEKQQQMEQDMFGTVALPFYAIVDGDGKIIGTFPGLTRKASEFVDFLKKAQEN
ncbi:MAG TPA: cytochrome c biogenesis protein CcdA [Pyrinomonadaceae bacterium]|nr:cytochrome c biogenesis protein CcdA [Pyrinomonadaceae bacterium]